MENIIGESFSTWCTNLIRYRASEGLARQATPNCVNRNKITLKAHRLVKQMVGFFVLRQPLVDEACKADFNENTARHDRRDAPCCNVLVGRNTPGKVLLLDT